MSELWDAYDRSFQKIENVTLVRGKPVPQGMYHLVSEVIVRHRDGTCLLMQRDHNKKFGGKWELTAGGSALQGETPLACAIRELFEETGLQVSEMNEFDRSVNERYRTLFVIFLCETDCEKEKITLQKGETIAWKWVTLGELSEMDPYDFASIRSRELILLHR